MKRAKLTATLALCIGVLATFGVGSASADFGITNFQSTYQDPFGSPGDELLQAGGHPDVTTQLDWNSTMVENGGRPHERMDGQLRDLEVDLPAGFSGNPQAIPTCTFSEIIATNGLCNPAAQVGKLTIFTELAERSLEAPVYSMVTPDTQTAVLGAVVLRVPAKIVISARTDGDYGLTANISNINQGLPLTHTTLEIWGAPADPIHDHDRFQGCFACPRGAHAEIPVKPFLSLPARCEPMITELHADSWQDPAPRRPDGTADLSDPRWISASDESPPLTGCDALAFAPTLKARPTTNAADSPSGLDLDLNLPQNSDDPDGLSPANMRKVEVSLPEGLVVNPSGANGLGACNLTQIGYLGKSNERQFLRFDPDQTATFTASFGGQGTAPIPVGASKAEATAALEALPGLAGNISLLKAPGGWIVTFSGALAGSDVATLSGSVDDNLSQAMSVTGEGGGYNLEVGGGSTEASFETSSGFAPGATFIEITNASRTLKSGELVKGPGIAPDTKIQALYGPTLIELSTGAIANESAGTQLKTALPFDASAKAIQDALQSIPAIGKGNVLVTATTASANTRSYKLLFTGDLAGTSPAITEANSLIGPGAGVVLTPQPPTDPHPLDVSTITNAGNPRFDRNPNNCPDDSKIGRVEVDTPAFPDPIKGSIYTMTPYENPFGSLLGLYIVVEGHGIVAKLPASVGADPKTGKLANALTESPQLPIENVRLRVDGGAQGVLRTPVTCGKFTTASTMTPWSFPATPIVNDQDEYEITQAPASGSCAASEAARPNTPSFEGGSVSPIAGAYKPFVVNLRRDDGTQQFSAVTLTPPPGLVAKLKGTATCSEAALAAAVSKTGRQEQASPSCPATSKVGTLYTAAGAGPAPYNAPGTVYLTGPYKGAPLSFAFVVPAVAGPFDLGNVIVRAAVKIDPTTAKVTTIADPLPQILKGIPLDVRSISVRLDKPDFTLNPTSCDPSAVTGTLLSTAGAGAALNTRFQLAECGRLKFKPSLSFSLKGKTKRSGHPALTAVLKPRAGDANIASVSVALPHSEFLAQNHIRTVCTRVQFAADACPKGSIYGKVSVVTPILDEPLTGPVYLRSSSNPLPDMVVDLHGPANQPIRFEAAGRIDSVNGGIRNTFDFVPDVPFTKLTLQLQGDKKGLLENSRNICKSTNRAAVSYTAHNGTSYSIAPELKAQGCKAKGSKGNRSSPRD